MPGVVFLFCLPVAFAACALTSSGWSSGCILGVTSNINNGFFGVPGSYMLLCNCTGGFYGTLDSSFFAGAPTNLNIILFYPGNIAGITAGTFSAFFNLTRISLETNRVSYISAGVFTGSTLTTIQLQENAITSFALNAFDNLPRLQSVELSKNLFSTWPVGPTFTNSPQAGVIMSDNFLSSPNMSNFGGRTILLISNPIAALTKDNFVNLPNLISLAVITYSGAVPPLSYLGPGVFSGCPRLQSVTLSFTGVVGPAVFSNHPSLGTISFSQLFSGVVSGISQLVNTPSLSLIQFSYNVPAFLSTSLLEFCNCRATVTVPTTFPPLLCPTGSIVDPDNTNYRSCVCEAGYVCTPGGAVACGNGSYSGAGTYVDSMITTCPECPAGSYNDGTTGGSCVFCDPGFRATNTSCIACDSIDPAACPPGTKEPLTLAQLAALASPPIRPTLVLENSSSQGPTLDIPLTIAISILATIGLLGFVLPWVARKCKISNTILEYMDLMSLAHKVAIGKSLVRRVSWLGVAMSLAFVCGAIIITLLLTDSNLPVTEYYLKFRENQKNAHNQLQFSIKPWVNDPACLLDVSFYEGASLIPRPFQIARSNSDNCTQILQWNMTSDTRLVFTIPVSVQSVRWTVVSTNIFGSPSTHADFVRPESIDYVFARDPVRLDFSVRDAFFKNDLKTSTEGLQVVFSKLDRGVPQPYISTPVIETQWQLEVRFSLLDTTLWGRTYLLQTNSQIFASVISVIVSLLAISRMVFAYGLEPLAQRLCRKQKGSDPDEAGNVVSVEMDRAAIISDLKKQLQQQKTDLKRCTAAIAKLEQNRAKH